MALNEVYAHAVLGTHVHVVRYYSAWAENNHMIIQNEYCNGRYLSNPSLGQDEMVGAKLQKPHPVLLASNHTQGLQKPLG